MTYNINLFCLTDILVPLAQRQFNIGIKHGQKRTNALKNHVRSLFLQKNPENICCIMCYFLHYFVSSFPDVSRTQFPRTKLVLGLGSTHLVTEANVRPRYYHIERCVAVH